MIDTSLLPSMLADARGLAHAAGAAILQVYERELEVMHKEDQSPLTEADLASHRIISEGLRECHPGIPLLSEESSAVPFEERRDWARYWLIDPLDGTKEFIKRNGEFTVNIALIEGNVVRFGVVYAPVKRLCYFGGQGLGAWRQLAGDDPQPIAVQSRCASPLRVVGSRSHAGESLRRVLERIGKHVLVSMGSSLKFCLVAEGAADFYPRLGPTSEWDTAAAQAIVEAAGGLVTNLELEPMRYNREDSLLNEPFLAFGDRDVDWRALVE